MTCEQLIGYILKALEVEEIAAIQQQLDGDVQVQQQWQLLICCLHPLQGDCEPCEVPDGLAGRTCQKVREVRRRERGCSDAEGPT